MVTTNPTIKLIIIFDIHPTDNFSGNSTQLTQPSNQIYSLTFIHWMVILPTLKAHSFSNWSQLTQLSNWISSLTLNLLTFLENLHNWPNHQTNFLLIHLMSVFIRMVTTNPTIKLIIIFDIHPKYLSLLPTTLKAHSFRKWSQLTQPSNWLFSTFIRNIYPSFQLL